VAHPTFVQILCWKFGRLSGIVFAGANNPPAIDSLAETTPDDGILTAARSHSCRSTELTWWCCRPAKRGLANRPVATGLIGIQRAFQVSGARSTVASLWKVPDLATNILMQRFYENFLDQEEGEEMSRLDALREAQLWVLNNPDKVRGATRDDDTLVNASIQPVGGEKTRRSCLARKLANSSSTCSADSRQKCRHLGRIAAKFHRVVVT
jgi:hypothetical protein